MDSPTADQLPPRSHPTKSGPAPKRRVKGSSGAATLVRPLDPPTIELTHTSMAQISEEAARDAVASQLTYLMWKRLGEKSGVWRTTAVVERALIADRLELLCLQRQLGEAVPQSSSAPSPSAEQQHEERHRTKDSVASAEAASLQELLIGSSSSVGIGTAEVHGSPPRCSPPPPADLTTATPVSPAEDDATSAPDTLHHGPNGGRRSTSAALLTDPAKDRQEEPLPHLPCDCAVTPPQRGGGSDVLTLTIPKGASVPRHLPPLSPTATEGETVQKFPSESFPLDHSQLEDGAVSPIKPLCASRSGSAHTSRRSPANTPSERLRRSSSPRPATGGPGRVRGAESPGSPPASTTADDAPRSDFVACEVVRRLHDDAEAMTTPSTSPCRDGVPECQGDHDEVDVMPQSVVGGTVEPKATASLVPGSKGASTPPHHSSMEVPNIEDAAETRVSRTVMSGTPNSKVCVTARSDDLGPPNTLPSPSASVSELQLADASDVEPRHPQRRRGAGASCSPPPLTPPPAPSPPKRREKPARSGTTAAIGAQVGLPAASSQSRRRIGTRDGIRESSMPTPPPPLPSSTAPSGGALSVRKRTATKRRRTPSLDSDAMLEFDVPTYLPSTTTGATSQATTTASSGKPNRSAKARTGTKGTVKAVTRRGSAATSTGVTPPSLKRRR